MVLRHGVHHVHAEMAWVVNPGRVRGATRHAAMLLRQVETEIAVVRYQERAAANACSGRGQRLHMHHRLAVLT